MRLAPCVCRILARKKDEKTGKVRLMSNPELMSLTGWSSKKLETLYKRTNWDEISVGDMELFLWACGIHPSEQRRHMDLLKRGCKAGRIRRLRHLKGTTVAWREFQIRALLRMCERVQLNEHNEAPAAG